MHDIRYDAVHDEIFVANPFAQAILTFRGDANGEEPPIRIIQGPHTDLQTPDVLEIDPVHNEVFVPDTGSIRVFRRDAQGDTAPLRTLRTDAGSLGGGTVVDPIHNILVNAGSISVAGKRQAALLIFNRTDSGDAKPRAIISGPKTGLTGTSMRLRQIYPEGGWIVVTAYTPGAEMLEPENAFVGIWSINDSGDVPPRWRINGASARPTNVLERPLGVALNPKYKEVIVSDMGNNAVLTYSLPEMFEAQQK